MMHPILMVWLLLMIRFESVYVYFIATKNVGDYSYMSSLNIYYRAIICILFKWGCNKMYFFTFSLQPFLHTETTKVLEIVLSKDILVVFPFLDALK